MSANVQTVAVATEELSASIAEIGCQMEQSARIAGQAVSEAEATTEAIRSLASLASQVDTVVQIISDIAGQTNLLALMRRSDPLALGRPARASLWPRPK